MKTHEQKTGQRTDLIKANLLLPVLAEKISSRLSRQKISVADIGSGDGSYIFQLLSLLAKTGISIDQLALVDADVKVFPTVLESSWDKSNSGLYDILQLSTVDRDDVFKTFIEMFEEEYDLFICQLVLHQILSDAEASLLIYLSSRLLTIGGRVYIIDLHPSYIKFLVREYPEKFKLLCKSNQSRIVGTYHFDSGGSITMTNREVGDVEVIIKNQEFDIVSETDIYTETLSDNNERYAKLADRHIPMFYILEAEKNGEHFMSATDAYVGYIRRYSDTHLHIIFLDHEYILFPKFEGWENVHYGDRIILQEINRDTKHFVNVWVIPNDETEQIWYRQVFA